MKIGLVCPASLPATQFGGILFLGVDLARELSNEKHEVTIYTTDLDFANNAKTFNKDLPKEETLENLINKAKENNTILLTTEKDYFRIDENYKQNINFLKIEVEIENRNQFIDELKKFDPRRIYRSDISEKLGL